MARALRDINVGVALMVGVASGYYIYEPLIRQHDFKRRDAEAELREVAKAADVPLERLQQAQLAKQAPFTHWLLYRGSEPRS